MNLDIEGDVTGQLAGGDIVNHGPQSYGGNVIVCNGGPTCPMRVNAVPASAQDEDEFHRATGIRASPRVRALLEEFREKHDLTWRGWGIALMWRHRSLEFDDVRGALKLKPCMTSMLYGGACAAFAAAFIVLVAVIVVNGTKTVEPLVWAQIIATQVAYGFVLWVSVQHMIAPEWISRRLLKKEVALEAGQS